MGLPTFLLFRDGEEVARLSDPEMTPPQLEEWLKENYDEQEDGG